MNRNQNIIRVAVLTVFALLLALPFAFRTRDPRPPADALELIILTPHNEQIRKEFTLRFDEWHRERFGEPVNVVWSTPGGTSEIRKMLAAQYEAALRSGKPIAANADLLFGGGSYEHTKLKRGVKVTVNGEERSTSISAPVELPQAVLDAAYPGDARVGAIPLYDSEGYWFGLAVSGFGIVYNNDRAREHLEHGSRRLGVSLIFVDPDVSRVGWRW